MQVIALCLLTGFLTLSPSVLAGNDVDKNGAKPLPPAETAPAPAFTKADCDEKIAALKKKHQGIIKKKNSQIADLKASLDKLKEKIESLKAENASLNEQLEAAQKPAPEPDVEEETQATGSANLFPWILALILAVVGFLIGRSTAGGGSSSEQS